MAESVQPGHKESAVKGRTQEDKTNVTIHPEALHLAKRSTAVVSGDSPGDSAPAADDAPYQTARHLGVVPPRVWSWDGFLAHVTWPTRLFRFSFIFQAVAALVALAHPGHILLYAPGDSLAYRLATPRTILENNDFLPVCGYAFVGFPRSPQSHTFVCSWGFAASPPSRNPKPFENRVLFLYSGYGGIGCACHTRTHLKNADAVLLLYCRNAQNPKRASEAASGCVSNWLKPQKKDRPGVRRARRAGTYS